jgi:hypothetical protein
MPAPESRFVQSAEPVSKNAGLFINPGAAA